MKMDINNLVGNVFNTNEIRRTVEIIKHLEDYAKSDNSAASNFLIIGNDRTLANMIALDIAKKSGVGLITVHAYNGKTLEENCKLLGEEGEPRIVYFENIDEFKSNDECRSFKSAIKDCINNNIFVLATLSSEWFTEEEMRKVREIKDCFARRIVLPKYQGNKIALELFKNYKIIRNVKPKFMSRIYTYQNYETVKRNLDDALIRSKNNKSKVIGENDLYYSVLGIDDDLLKNFVEKIGIAEINTCVYAAGRALAIELLYPGSLLAVSAVDNGYPKPCYGNILCDYIDSQEDEDDLYKKYMISVAGNVALKLSLDMNAHFNDFEAHDYSELSESEKSTCLKEITEKLNDNMELLDDLGSELINTGFVSRRKFERLKDEIAFSKSVTMYGICSDNGEESCVLEAYILDGCLKMKGVEEGEIVKERFGSEEYLYTYKFDVYNTTKLQEAFESDDLLSALQGFFHGEHRDSTFFDFCKEHEIEFETHVL